jgi:hypothetical protein
MEDWVTVDKVYPFEAQAQKAAQIVRVTESRLLSTELGLQYDVETELVESPTGWQIRWRKVLLGNGSGCGGCSSCQDQSQKTPVKSGPQSGTVILFKPRQNREKGRADGT